eukprot:jgi/Tetstr1/463926/TSEL_008733.t1
MNQEFYFYVILGNHRRAASKLVISRTEIEAIKQEVSKWECLVLCALNELVARYIGNRQNVTNANTTINTQLDNFRLLRKEYEMLREIDDKRPEGEGDEEEFSYKRWSSESKDDLVTDPVMKEKYSRFSYLSMEKLRIRS